MDHAETSLLGEYVPLLGFALLFVLVFRRLGLGATLGYLVAGAIVGPQVLGLVGDAEGKLGIAELGIAFLLFLVGLELSPGRLWRMRRDIFGLGLLQVTICGLIVAAMVWFATGSSIGAALALGLPLALSSTAQVLPLLQSAGRLRTPLGERAFAILLFQDLSIVPLITIIAALSRNPADQHGAPGWMLGLFTVAAIVGLVLAGRYLLRPLFRLIGNLGEREMFIFAGLFTVIAVAAIMQRLGLSPALGAFIAGVMLADSPYRHELEADVEPFRSILLGLFFLAVGMTLNLHAIAERPFFVIGMALALIAAKAAIIMGLGMLFGMPRRQAFALGVLLSQGGEFGFVLFAQAQSAMLIEGQAASIFGAIVTLSMATTPFLMMATKRLRTEPEPSAAGLDLPRHEGSNAVVVGYGRFGQTVAQMLLSQDIPVTIIDTDVEMIQTANDFGMKVYYGDGLRIDMLRQAGAAEAELVMFCNDGDKIDTEFLEAVHYAFPKSTVFVRAYDRRSVIKMKGAPVGGVVREVLESAVMMARQAMQAVGVDQREIDKTEAEYRKRDNARLDVQRETGDLRAGIDGMITHASRAAAIEVDLESSG
ncbi:CPA2 family monovalent cation:H+ antiporter-2/glutathione-regulated potassium-efflux system protein KefB [Sphingomonas kyeonggiensis]|uniref:CPA2 family monovalent cation:H+ antiporter-2/glutathione-regulated potassium-efflux system protein KefB n=1 Tax=Sphingomonas kyeonggiensis TaxID=1268553 RepID=A0A7W7K3D9_9SPHN|nr:cation:proton antiporter [Sphingomonas kyeonggiensis]MBB4839655.1 CPA2 family monovalent cation:H+ antiporter-2/glutathione-regulated potassium-efflux system protein KefB [Sphingomonas kyeonggiensis]